MSKKVDHFYLLVYSSALGTKEEVKQCIDSLPQITNWRTDLPNCFYIVSPLTDAEELTDLISEKMNQKKRFIIVELGVNTNGYLPKETWLFLGPAVLNRE